MPARGEAKSVFPRERPIVETRDVVFLYVSEGKVMHGVRHDFQLSASARPFVSLGFLQLNPGFLDNQLRQFNSAPASPVSTKRSAGGSVSTRPQTTMKWSPAIQKGTARR